MLKRRTVAAAGSNEQGEYCRAVLKLFCWIAKNRDINHLLYFYFTFYAYAVCTQLHSFIYLAAITSSSQHPHYFIFLYLRTDHLYSPQYCSNQQMWQVLFHFLPQFISECVSKSTVLHEDIGLMTALSVRMYFCRQNTSAWQTGRQRGFAAQFACIALARLAYSSAVFSQLTKLKRNLNIRDVQPPPAHLCVAIFELIHPFDYRMKP